MTEQTVDAKYGGKTMAELAEEARRWVASPEGQKKMEERRKQTAELKKALRASRQIDFIAFHTPLSR